MTSVPQRVVITGAAVICPFGSTKDGLWDGLSQGRSGVRPLSLAPTEGLPARFGAEATQFTGEIDDFGPLEKEQKKAIRKGLKVMCRECQMGVAVAQLALIDAQVQPGALAPERTGIAFGSDHMLTVPEEFSEGVAQCRNGDGRFQFSRWGTEGLPKMSPLWLLKYLPNMPASHLAIYNDFRGPNNSLTMREAAANAAIADAYHIIRRGNAEVMIAGATGTRLHPLKLVQVLGQEEVARGDGDPTTWSRPFDRDRRGMVLGEGAGAILLEELSAAQARGATIYGEVVATASSSAAGQRLLAERGRAMENVLRMVLQNAEASVNDVGHLHAHGLSTRSCDAEEARAIQAVFGGRATPLPVTAAKSYFGNLGAGSGMIELIASLLAMQHDCLFPILNYATPDPECLVSVVGKSDRPGASFINLSVTPQGQASAVMVRRYR